MRTVLSWGPWVPWWPQQAILVPVALPPAAVTWEQRSVRGSWRLAPPRPQLLQPGEVPAVAQTRVGDEVTVSWWSPSTGSTHVPQPTPAPVPATLQQALEVELGLLVQLLHARRAPSCQEDIHGLLPWQLGRGGFLALEVQVRGGCRRDRGVRGRWGRLSSGTAEE